MTPHLVADEIRRRRARGRHLITWDDYDRFRKVPAGIDPSWAEHIGKPLTAVPAPPGSPHASWAEHFRAPADRGAGRARRRLPRDQPDRAVHLRAPTASRSCSPCASGRTSTRSWTATAPSPARRPGGARSPRRPRSWTSRRPPQPGGRRGLRRGGRGRRAGSAAGYYPYKPYCAVCGKDFTTVTAYDDDTTELTYTCRCGHAETCCSSEFNRGKLVWKVDWPMRWAYEGVVFEPSGVDHSSPGSSWVVGGQIVEEVFGGSSRSGRCTRSSASPAWPR